MYPMSQAEHDLGLEGYAEGLAAGGFDTMSKLTSGVRAPPSDPRAP